MIYVDCDPSKLNAQKDMLISLFKPHLEGRKVIYCDVPVHGNVGDSLIYSGVMELFDILKVRVVDSVSAYEPERIKNMVLEDDVVIVCQGGGNFGDIYTLHQGFRHLILDCFPNNKIILMPQSIHYDNVSIFKRDCQRYRMAPNYFIFVRDEHSYDSMMAEGVDNVFLCPDIATLLLGKFDRVRVHGKRTLYFMRKDVEAKNQGDTTKGVDWVDIINPVTTCSFGLASYLIKKNNRLNISYLTHFLVKVHHFLLVNQACKYFSKFDTVQTDRLHGLIFSQLLNMQCEALDNSYGKLARYIKKWYV
jgi:pyruvyl transferase EpsO